MAKIFIDAGHGGHGSGARGARSHEKNNVLKVALKIKPLLQQHGHAVRLSRETDVYLTLSQRAALANTWGADLFISLHNNSATNKAATGFETFIYDKTTNVKTAHLQRVIHSAIIKELDLRDRVMKKANFAVLRETNMPACLIEYAFISNYQDETLLINQDEKLARLTVQGINDYFGKSMPSAVPKADEEKVTYLELNQRQKDELALIYKTIREQGIFTSAEHETNVKSGKMTVSQAAYLATVIAGAAVNNGNRIK